jgi:uncharacterized membrane protein YgcG
MILRYVFIIGYFNIERVIRGSVSKHEDEVAMAHAAGYSTITNNGTTTTINGNSSANGTAPTHGGSHDEHPPNNNHNTTTNTNTNTTIVSETEALQLQLNDLSCSLASGVGYATLHALFLYGSLLASESGESNSYNDAGSYVGGGGSTGYGGTLYQNSCSTIPSLLQGAFIAMAFSILDVLWMMVCFYGMRRINNNNNNRSFPSSITRGGGRGVGRIVLQILTCHGFDNDDTDSTTSSTTNGYTALLFVTITHLLASLVLLPNSYTNGCIISLPCLVVVVIWVMIVLGNIVRKNQFLPVDQQCRISTMRQQQQQQQQVVSDGHSSSSNENGMMMNGRSFI